MNARQALSRLNKLLEEVQTVTSGQYATSRDDRGNLAIIVDNDRYQLPIFEFRPYQYVVQLKLFMEQVRRIFLVWPRRSGKEVVSWNLLIEAAIETPGLYLMIYPTNVRARFVLWDGAITMPDGSSLKFLDMIPRPLIVGKPNAQEMSIKLTNGSVIRVLGSDIEPDKLRGVNARGAVFSEYAFSDPRVYHILMPVFRQNGGWIILQTTYNGMNHAYQYMREVQSNDQWYCRVESCVTLTDENNQRYITDEMIEEERKAGMPDYLINQEYFSKVEINQDTMYFSQEVNHLYENEKIIPGLFLHDSPVFAFYDLGINDNMAVTLSQFDHNGKPVILCYFEDRNKTWEHYLTEAKRFCLRHNLYLKEHFSPHDGKNRNAETGNNIVTWGATQGESYIIVPRPQSKINAIQSMRRQLYHTRFNKEHTTRLIDCLANYSKEFDEKHKIYKNNPVHDWSSHGVDSFQTLTLALENGMINTAHREVVYYNS